jgi:hypothetical protein
MPPGSGAAAPSTCHSWVSQGSSAASYPLRCCGHVPRHQHTQQRRQRVLHTWQHGCRVHMPIGTVKTQRIGRWSCARADAVETNSVLLFVPALHATARPSPVPLSPCIVHVLCSPCPALFCAPNRQASPSPHLVIPQAALRPSPPRLTWPSPSSPLKAASPAPPDPHLVIPQAAGQQRGGAQPGQAAVQLLGHDLGGGGGEGGGGKGGGGGGGRGLGHACACLCVEA